MHRTLDRLSDEAHSFDVAGAQTPAVISDGLAHRAAAAVPSAETVAVIAELDSASLSDDGRLSYIQAIEGAQSWLSSLTTQPLADLIEPAARSDAADGDLNELEQASVREEVRVALALSSPAVRSRIEVARELAGRLCATQAALACGSITFIHARTIVEAISGLDDEIALAVETRVLSRSTDRPLSTLRRQLRSALATLDTVQILERHTASRRS